MYYTAPMGTTTVRIDDEVEAMLDRLAVTYGGKSKAIRAAVRTLSAEVDRKESLADLLDAWATEAGPLDDRAVDEMIDRYGL